MFVGTGLKRAAVICITLICMLSITLVVPCNVNEVRAESDFQFTDHEFEYGAPGSFTLTTTDTIESCTSSDPKLVEITSFSGNKITIKVKKNYDGSITIKANDKNKNTAVCYVKHKKELKWNGKTLIIDKYKKNPGINEAYTEDGYGNLAFYFWKYVTSYNCYNSNYTIGNTKVLNWSSSEIAVVPVGVGNTKVKIEDKYPIVSCAIPVKVKLNYFIGMEKAHEGWGKGTSHCDGYGRETSRFYFVFNQRYGDKKVNGWTFRKAKVDIMINGKHYKGKADNDGYFSIKVPRYNRLGKKIRIKTSKYNVTKRYTKKVVSNKPKIKIKKVTTRSSKIKVIVKKAHKGDLVKIKIGKQSFKKKIKSNSRSIKITKKIKKQKHGAKITVRLLNKYKQKLASKNTKVR